MSRNGEIIKTPSLISNFHYLLELLSNSLQKSFIKIYLKKIARIRAILEIYLGSAANNASKFGLSPTKPTA